MHPSRVVRSVLLVGWFAVTAMLPALAQDETGSDSFLESYAATFRFRLGRPGSIRPTPDGRAVLFLRSGPRSFTGDLYELSVGNGNERFLLRATDLLGGSDERLSAAERARRERMRMTGRGIAKFELSADGRRVLVPLSGRLFVIERPSGDVQELPSRAGFPLDARFSPDGTKVACVRDGELYVTELATARERRLTSGAGGTISHGLAEFVAQEEMRRYHGYWWSPDSRFVVYQRTDTAGVEVFHIADATRPERTPQSWPYPRPGRRNADVRLGIIPVEGGETTWIEWDRERYEYLAAVSWVPRAPLTILVQNRKQTEERLLAVDTEDGSTTTLLVERDDAWLRIDQQMPRWLPDGRAFLWITEREGAKQLELRSRDGERVGALNDPDFGLQAFELLLAASNEAIVRASRDPTQSALYRLSLDVEHPAAVPLTPEAGVHSVVSQGVGPLFVYSRSGMDQEVRYELADREGARGIRLRSVAEQPGFVPNLEFTTVGEDPSFHAVIVRPRAFDGQHRYPVIVHVYGGPGAQMVRRQAERYLFDQWVADRGYVVVAIDGRGTPGRGREWERAIKRNLIDLPLQDQAQALKLLGQRYPELDLERVGIYGWSFGGYFTAMAVMRRPELFRVGMAGAPVASWEDYDTHYTERFMDLPQDNPDGYKAANVLSYADELSRPLLLVHGTADDNVYFMHSLKLADALLRSGKQFEFLPLPGFTHMVPEPGVTVRLHGRMMELFDRHLRSESD